ncbi:MAG: tRNA1(Val) (adenine(37)-N6)-methyltransferase [Clostridia bacterium]|nr:tRNA1(Val) (adenine(37)-N6)-methyltransferase [Clostridia bacterium]
MSDRVESQTVPEKAQIPQEETLEDLGWRNLRIFQKKEGFRYGMDAVLLADFARMGRRDRVADLGTGTGILPILLFGRDKGDSYDVFELQETMADMARRSFEINGMEAFTSVHIMDVSDIPQKIPPCQWDHVICNPPYGTPGGGIKNPSETIALSRHQGEEGISPWLRSAAHLLRSRGRLSIIYPAQRMLELMTKMQEMHLEPKRIRLIYPRVEKAANLVLIEAQKDARPLLHTEPPLIVYGMDGQMTEELKKIYHLVSSEHL